MRYICPICKYNGTKHITLYGAKLLNDCPICLSTDTFGEVNSNNITIDDEELKLQALECGHILHAGCINSLVNHTIPSYNRRLQTEIVSDREINIQRSTSERREDGIEPVQRQRFQELLPNTLHYNELADITDSYVFREQFIYHGKLCKWRRSYNNTIILYEATTLDICITRGIRVHSPWPFDIEEHHRIDWNNITETRGYWTMILNYY
jgi:hypothetical protein